MFENIDLQIADDKKSDSLTRPVFSTYNCTRTGCWGTNCKYAC